MRAKESEFEKHIDRSQIHISEHSSLGEAEFMGWFVNTQ